MQVQDLFEYSVLRAVLTVSESELPDTLLSSYGIEDDVTAELNRRVEGWRDISDEDQLVYLRLFVKYYAASVISVTAPLFVLKKETDGNNEGQRSDKDGFAFVASAMRDKAESALSTLLGLLGIVDTAPTPALADRVPPNRDIITQARGTV